MAFLIRSLDYGGAERQLVTLAVALHRKGVPVVAVVFYGGGPLEQELCEAGVRVRRVGKSGRWDVAGFLLRLLRILREERPAVLHSYLDVPNVVAASLNPFIRGTRVVWGIRASDMDLRRYDRFSRATFRLQALLSRTVERVIANSRAGRDYHCARGFPRARVSVVPNGIDTGRFRPDPEGRARVRAEWGVAEQEILVGLAARLDPMKDHPTFLRAAALLAARDPRFRFVCVGNGPDPFRGRLVAAARDLGLEGRLLWSPAREDVPAVLSAFDVACSSSAFGEGFSNAVAEAMACGVACAVTDVGDSAWIVDGLGEVVPPGDAEALAAALERLGGNRSSGASDRVRARIVEHFSVERLVAATEEVLWPA